jgi:hypothetical protein
MQVLDYIQVQRIECVDNIGDVSFFSLGFRWNGASSTFIGRRDRVNLALSRFASSLDSNTSLLPGMPVCHAKALPRINSLRTTFLPLTYFTPSRIPPFTLQLPARVPPRSQTLYSTMSTNKKQGTLKYVRSSQQTLGWDIYASVLLVVC